MHRVDTYEVRGGGGVEPSSCIESEQLTEFCALPEPPQTQETLNPLNGGTQGLCKDARIIAHAQKRFSYGTRTSGRPFLVAVFGASSIGK